MNPKITESTRKLAQAVQHYKAGELDQAEGVYRELLAATPTDARAYYGLGLIYLARQAHTEALRCFGQAYEHATGLDRRLSGLARVRTLRNLGRPDEGYAVLEVLIDAEPDVAELHFENGLTLVAAGRDDEAVDAFRTALELQPDYAAASNELGKALQDLGRLDEAEVALRQAVVSRPDVADIHNNLGNVLEAQAKVAEAEQLYRKAVELAPGRPWLHHNLANVLKFQGRVEEAANVMRTGLDHGPDYLTGYGVLAALDASLVTDQEAERLEQILNDELKSGGTVPDGHADLCFALARIYERRGQYDLAFPWYQCGNDTLRAAIDLDVEREERWFAEIARVFDRKFMDVLEKASSPSRAPIFIVGMPRSGSTLVEQILASHSRVAAGGEMPHMQNLIAGLSPNRPEPPRHFLEALESVGVDELRRMGQSYLDETRSVLGSDDFFTDKMLSHFIFLGLIHVLFPEACFVHTVRDPVDTCLACYRQPFATPRAFYFTFSLSDLARYHRAYQRLMSHWHSLLPRGQILDVIYEDMVESQEETTRRLLDHCGLKFESQCLEFYKASRAIKTASTVQVRNPIYKGSVGYWRHYEGFLTPLLEELGITSQ